MGVVCIICFMHEWILLGESAALRRTKEKYKSRTEAKRLL